MNSQAFIPANINALKCELAGEVLRSSGTLRVRATGWSMLPTVWPGDTLVIERIQQPGAVSEGDIAMFSNGRRFVAHRVVAKGNGSGASMVQTQGDAVPHPDSPITRGDLLGKVAFILRNGTCITPRKTLGFSERALAALFRRSEIVARLAVGVRRMRPSSKVQASQVQV